MGMIRKALRNKDVRVNGNKIKDDVILQKNDCEKFYSAGVNFTLNFTS